MSYSSIQILWNKDTDRYVLSVDEATCLDLIDALSSVRHVHRDRLRLFTSTSKFARMTARIDRYPAHALTLLSAWTPHRVREARSADRRFQPVLTDARQAG